MLLTPTELERLTIYTAAELARKRRAKGLKLNYPEATAIIADEILEGAREGRSVADLMPVLQVEATFPDGTKLVTVHDPIRPGKQRKDAKVVAPGEIFTPDGDIELNVGRRKATIKAVNTGDRPIQIGSHYHFFEANKALDFDRAASFGMHLDIPAGTAVRFEPGEAKEVTLASFGGSGEIFGLNNLTDGPTHGDSRKNEALARAKAKGFRGA